MTHPRPTIDPENPFAAALAALSGTHPHSDDNKPVAKWATQGGGLAAGGKGERLIFIEAPDCPGLDVGDPVPEEWGLIPVNDAAHEEMDGF
tara:strand:- start:86 stop:358 length:273 start_codon:yes stop_codon:yes gene_type:complete